MDTHTLSLSLEILVLQHNSVSRRLSSFHTLSHPASKTKDERRTMQQGKAVSAFDSRFIRVCTTHAIDVL